MKEPISIVKATQMSKADLIKFLYEDEADKIEEYYHKNKWTPRNGDLGTKYHYSAHARDTRDGEIVNLIDYGRKLCLIN